MEYDFKDLLVQDMVDRDHIPCEQRFYVRNKEGELVHQEGKVVCDQCGEPWPCRARVELRQYQKDHLKRVR